jgi:hypothetical protein
MIIFCVLLEVTGQFLDLARQNTYLHRGRTSVFVVDAVFFYYSGLYGLGQHFFSSTHSTRKGDKTQVASMISPQMALLCDRIGYNAKVL